VWTRSKRVPKFGHATSEALPHAWKWESLGGSLNPVRDTSRKEKWRKKASHHRETWASRHNLLPTIPESTAGFEHPQCGSTTLPRQVHRVGLDVGDTPSDIRSADKQAPWSLGMKFSSPSIPQCGCESATRRPRILSNVRERTHRNC